MRLWEALLAGMVVLGVMNMTWAAERQAGDVAGPLPKVAREVVKSAGRDVTGHVRWRVDLAALGQIANAQRSLNLIVPVESDAPVTMRLQRFEVTTAQTRFSRADRQGQVAPVAAPEVSLWRGEVANAAGSHVFLALNARGGAIGNIALHGQRFDIASERVDADGETIVIRPGGGDLPEFEQFCAMISSPQHMVGLGPVIGSGQWRGPRVLNVAVDADQAYVNLFPANNVASAQAYIVSVLGAVSDIFMRDLDMTIVLRFSRVWPNGGEPFTATDIAGFRQHWVDNEDRTGLNLVHLFSGRRDTGYGGVAYLTSGCSDFGFGISAFLLGQFPSPVAMPGGANLWNWDVSVIAHEMGHNLGTLHTHDYVPPIDTCTTGPSQRGTIMSYCHATAGGLLNTDMNMHTRVAGVIAANNPPNSCLWHDCNGNAIDDADDISSGTSLDIDTDGVPDECQDCNANGVLDSTEIAAGATDVNANGRLDSCEPDCNGNAVPDALEIQFGMSEDENGNGLPDMCEPDCDGNGRADFLDILDGSQIDLDRNSVPDACQDCNANGVSDWIDIGRAFNIFISQTHVAGSLREYHARSGVLVRDLGAGAVSAAYDAEFGPDRQLYVASYEDHRIVKIDVDSGIASHFVSNAVGLVNPTALAFGPDGHLYVASEGTSSILRFHGTTGTPLGGGTFVTSGLGGLTSPRDIAFAPNGQLLVISGGHQILRFHGSNGSFLGVFAANPTAQLDNPRRMAILPTGHLLVTNSGANRITRFDANGAFLGKFNDVYPLPLPWAIAVAPNGNILAAQTAGNLRVIEYDVNSGRYLRSYVRGDSNLTAPTAIAFRPASPNDVNRNGVPDVCEPPICLADVSPLAGGDGVVNVNDLLAVINAWGPCPLGCLPYCPADITFDCTINVNDLLAVINGWGPCR